MHWGGTLVGRADDPSALSYNPAGITQLEGDHIMFGLTAIRPAMDISFDSFGTWSNEDNTWVPPHFYYTRQMSDKYWFGISATSRFGLGAEFDEDWPGKYNNYYACIQSFSVTPTLAMKVNDKLSIAAGVEAMWFEFEQKKQILTPASDVDAGVKGDDIGWGWNFALHFKPSERVKLGFFYRSEVDQTVEGNVDFTTPVGLEALFPDTTGSGQVTLPESFSGGIAYQLTDKTSVEVGAIFTKWSSYDALTINYGTVIPATGVDYSSSIKDWNDVWRYQLGIEHALTDHSWLRFGYVYDNSPVPDDTIDYIVPANDRQIYSIGYGFTTRNWTYDLSYAYLDIKERHIAERSDEWIYDSDISNSDTHLFGISVSYSF
jgi:long-chain fatty acid transport protein